MQPIDLRSDTITLPTKAMRKAMAEAEVGDDVFGEDPTVSRLEKMAAKLMGKEAALFVSSGTMANLICQMTHCGRGDEMILGDQAHVFYYEQGGSAAIGGIHSKTIPNRSDGSLDLSDIEKAIRPDNIHFPVTRLIVLENTQNRCNGQPLDAVYMASVGLLARKYGLNVHVDGARIFNAAIALNVDAKELAEHADSINFCLSKGLSAPVGSIVCGSTDFIQAARRNRKVLGGGMRQAGVLAAAGIVALDEMVDRLTKDHENAKRLASGLAEIEGLSIELKQIRTNIVYVKVEKDGLDADRLVKKLEQNGIRTLSSGPRQLRAVTHRHISSEDIEMAISAFRKVMG